jgi:hypothetical protein
MINELTTVYEQNKFSNIIRIFSNEHISLNIHYWPEGITNCHCHQFSGAFRIVQGKALHLKWNFRQQRVLTEFMSEGELGLVSKNIIDSNQIELIQLGGDKMIHQLIYLERPTFTLVLRSKKIDGFEMDEFFYPGMCIKTVSNLDDFIDSFATIKSISDLYIFLNTAPSSLVLGVYSGALEVYFPFLRANFSEVQQHIQKRYSGAVWFDLYLVQYEKHKKLLEKLLLLES